MNLYHTALQSLRQLGFQWLVVRFSSHYRHLNIRTAIVVAVEKETMYLDNILRTVQ